MARQDGELRSRHHREQGLSDTRETHAMLFHEISDKFRTSIDAFLRCETLNEHPSGYWKRLSVLGSMKRRAQLYGQV